MKRGKREYVSLARLGSAMRKESVSRKKDDIEGRKSFLSSVLE